MSLIKVLALSSSRVGNSGYLETALPLIKNFLGNKSLNIAFIPFASVDNYSAYASMVKEGLAGLPYNIHLVEAANAISVIEECDAIMVGGGNTFKLLHHIFALNLFEIIQKKVNSGMPFIGWSAGSNITGLTIGTTNDMPIIEPRTFKAFGFFPFQINPHYINVKPEGHNGESRDQRLTEFLKVNPTIPIVGLPEGTALLLVEGVLRFLGPTPAVLFESKKDEVFPFRKQIVDGTDLSYLLR